MLEKIPTVDGSTGSQQALISVLFTLDLSQNKRGFVCVSFVEIEQEGPHFSSVTILTVTVRYSEKEKERRWRIQRRKGGKEQPGVHRILSMRFLLTLVYAGFKTDFFTIRSVTYATSFSVFYQSDATTVSPGSSYHAGRSYMLLTLLIVHKH